MQKPKPIKTAITEMFGLDYPIIGAPMFLVSNEAMVIATSLAGGLGTFPALNFRPLKKYEETLQDLNKKLNGRSYGINVIVQKSNRYQHDQIDKAIENEVSLIITSLGNPKVVIEKTRGTKTKVFCDVVGLTHAKKPMV